MYSQIYFTTVPAKSLIYYICVNNMALAMSVQSPTSPFNTVSQSFLVLLSADDAVTIRLGRSDLTANLISNASFFGAFLIELL